VALEAPRFQRRPESEAAGEGARFTCPPTQVKGSGRSLLRAKSKGVSALHSFLFWDGGWICVVKCLPLGFPKISNGSEKSRFLGTFSPSATSGSE